MMGKTSIVKLGGSIITDKRSGRPVLRTRRVQEIAREIAGVLRKKPALRLVLLYGAGSFGHPLAHRYQLLDKPLSKRTLNGVGYTISAMRELGTRLATIFLDAGIPIVPLQTSSFTRVRQDCLHFASTSVIETILENDGVPLLGGDVVFSDHERTAIASADGLAVALAKKLKSVRLYFATDTDGVYASFPPRMRERPLRTLNRTGVKNLLKTQRSRTTRIDITGAMPGKLRALLDVRGTTAVIFNGNTRGAISDVLYGEKRGTRIVL